MTFFNLYISIIESIQRPCVKKKLPHHKYDFFENPKVELQDLYIRRCQRYGSWNDRRISWYFHVDLWNSVLLYVQPVESVV